MSGGSVIMHGGPGVIGPGGLSDGSWTLTVFVTDLQVERSLRVRGDLHIGGVMIRLVDELGKTIIFLIFIKGYFWSSSFRRSLEVLKGPERHYSAG